MPEFAPQIAAMIGLGVGIDYALFIVTRYRENFHNGMEPRRRRGRKRSTRPGGRCMFAGITVMISLLGLFIIGLAFVRGLAIGQRRQRAGDDGGGDHAAARAHRLRRQARRRDHAGPRPIAVGRLRGCWRWPACSPASPSALLCSAPALLAVVVMVVSCLPFGQALRKHAAAPQRQSRASSSSGTAGAALIQHRPWPPLLIGVGIWCCWRCRCSRSASASATPATSRKTRRRARPTT